jgi:hypothetical protein
MKQSNALFKRFALACCVVAFAALVCGAQTPGGNNNGSSQSPASTARTTTAAGEKTADKTSPLDEELSKTPAGKTVAKFFAAFNSGDLKTMRAFHESTGGDPENADKDLGFHEQTGGLKLHSLTSTAGDKIAVLAQAKKDARWLTIHFTLEPGEPYGISSIGVRPAAPPAP